MAKRSKNDITIEQLTTACRHFYELKKLDVTENIAIRQPLKMVDIYAKMRVIGKCSVDKANEFDYWSIEAEKVWKQAQLKDPKAKYGSFLRIEHGTPRTQFTKIANQVSSATNTECRARFQMNLFIHIHDYSNIQLQLNPWG